MKMVEGKTGRIVISIILAITELVGVYFIKEDILDSLGKWVTFLSYLTPFGFLYFFNYYIVSPVLIQCGFFVLKQVGWFRIYTKKFRRVSNNCVSWLINTKVQWGLTDIADESQYANTCEVLIAIKKAKMDQKNKTIFEDSLFDIINRSTEMGLASRSLQCETVVCTSMLLYLYSLTRGEFYYSDMCKDKIYKIVDNLWRIKCKKGWGVYVSPGKDEDCSLANTFWVLRALTGYEISKSEEYKNMVRRIYEGSCDSCFGYRIGDQPRLCTTAMAVGLFYSLDEDVRDCISEIFDIKKAVHYVYNMFCHEKIECEVEILKGLNNSKHSIKQVPWEHITVGWVTEALVEAYKSGDFSSLKMNAFIKYINKICSEEVVSSARGDKQSYYCPRNMVIRTEGISVFPTAYMVWALNSFEL